MRRSGVLLVMPHGEGYFRLAEAIAVALEGPLCEVLKAGVNLAKKQ